MRPMSLRRVASAASVLPRDPTPAAHAASDVNVHAKVTRRFDSCEAQKLLRHACQILSINIPGLRSVFTKHEKLDAFRALLSQERPDVICIQVRTQVVCGSSLVCSSIALDI